jgi:hypothetical protein
MIRKAEGEEAQREAAVTDYETRLLGFHGFLCVETLAAIKGRYGSIDSWLDTPMIEPAVVEKFLSALALYEQGQFDAAASMLAPRIERAIRSIARHLGFPVTGSQHRDGTLSEVKSLRPLLDTLKLALPDATYRYLKLLLVDQTSFNLRNRIGHGLLDEAGQSDAALLIHAACHLSVLQPAPVPDKEE